MNAKKKIAAIAVAAALVATTAISATLAYFTDTKEKTNTFTVGNVNITLTEPNWDGEGSSDAPEAYPGEALKKDPTVTNVGKNPCFVRIKVKGLDCLGENNMITIEGLSNDWTLIDGYYYYNHVLPIKEATPALFQQIRIPTSVTNGFNGNYDVVVTAEAVQAQGARPSWDKPDKNDPLYPGVKQMTVEQIADWFDICMPASTTPDESSTTPDTSVDGE